MIRSDVGGLGFSHLSQRMRTNSPLWSRSTIERQPDERAALADVCLAQKVQIETFHTGVALSRAVMRLLPMMAGFPLGLCSPFRLSQRNDGQTGRCEKSRAAGQYGDRQNIHSLSP